MKRVFRWIGYVVAVLVVLALGFSAWVWFASARVLGRTYEAAPERLAQPSAAQLADGERQARVLGCIDCHGEGLRGRMMFEAPNVARVWAPNLNELAARVNDQQLAQAIRQGIGHDGRALFVMPSPMYAHMTDQEVAALIAWMRTVPRSGAATTGIEWGPIGRYALASGGFPTAVARVAEFRARQPFDTGPEQAAGRHIAMTVCTECHGADLSGGQPTPDITAPDLSISGAYDREQFRRLMRTGRPPNGRDLGLMGEVSRSGLNHFTDGEIDQVYDYLQARAHRVAQ